MAADLREEENKVIEISGRGLAGLARGVEMFKSVRRADERFNASHEDEGFLSVSGVSENDGEHPVYKVTYDGPHVKNLEVELHLGPMTDSQIKEYFREHYVQPTTIHKIEKIRNVKNASDPKIYDELQKVRAAIAKIDPPTSAEAEKTLAALRTTKAGLERALKESDKDLKNAGKSDECVGHSWQPVDKKKFPGAKEGEQKCRNCGVHFADGKIIENSPRTLWVCNETGCDFETRSRAQATAHFDETDHEIVETDEESYMRKNAEQVEYPHDVLPNNKEGLDRGRSKYGK